MHGAVVLQHLPGQLCHLEAAHSLEPHPRGNSAASSRTAKLGGTIRGVTENLDYLADLGVNCIYLNPIFAAGEYHKYDLIDYYHIDPCFGTDEDFRELVDTAHGMGMRVIIDGVFNHTSWRHPFFQDVLRRGKASPFWRYYYALPEDVRFPAKGEAPATPVFPTCRRCPRPTPPIPAARLFLRRRARTGCANTT